MAAAIITIPIRWCAVVTASCRSISMCRAARRPPRRCSTACCCCRRKSAAPERSSADAMSDDLHGFGETLAAALPGAVTGHQVAYGELTVAVKVSEIVEVIRFLREDERCKFWSFIDVTAVDWPGRERRFDAGYHLLSPVYNRRVRVKAEVGEDETVDSIIGIFPGADWF